MTTNGSTCFHVNKEAGPERGGACPPPAPPAIVLAAAGPAAQGLCPRYRVHVPQGHRAAAGLASGPSMLRARKEGPQGT